MIMYCIDKMDMDTTLSPFDTMPNLKYYITGDLTKFTVQIQNNDKNIFYDSNDSNNIKGSILDDNARNDAIEKINTKLNTAMDATGGKRSTSKSRKTQLRDEHGRFLPSNKRKNGRQRRTVKRPII